MSTGTKLGWSEAATIAERIAVDLTTVCIRAKAAGSLRRRKAEVGDIEFVIEPRQVETSLFGESTADIEAIRAVASQWGPIIKGGDKMIQVALVEGITCELYIVTPPAQWGSILAIRTGPAELGRHAVTCMLERGYRHTGGHVIDRTGQTVPTPTEEDFFRLAGLPCLPPRARDRRDAFRSLQGENA